MKLCWEESPRTPYDTTPVDRPACEEALSIVTKDYKAVMDAINRYVEENN